MISFRELRKPDAALFVREAAIKRFPAYDVADAIPDGAKVVELERPLILIYSQAVFRDSEWTWAETLAYRVFAGSRAYPDQALEIAAAVEAFLWTTPRPGQGSPIAAVTDSSGPNLVNDVHETAVLYGTVETIIGGVYAPASTGVAGE